MTENSTQRGLENLAIDKKRVVSGMRPTGKLHIGHYFGALQNWVRLQNDPEYDCFYFIADWHALTSDYADTSAVAQNTIEIVTDYLAAGLDPKLVAQIARHPDGFYTNLHNAEFPAGAIRGQLFRPGGSGRDADADAANAAAAADADALPEI